MHKHKKHHNYTPLNTNYHPHKYWFYWLNVTVADLFLWESYILKMRTTIVASLALKFFLLYFAVFVVVFYFRYSAHTPARLSFKTHRLRLCNAGRAKSKSAAHTGAQPLQSLSIFESLIEDCKLFVILFWLHFRMTTDKDIIVLLQKVRLKNGSSRRHSNLQWHHAWKKVWFSHVFTFFFDHGQGHELSRLRW